MSGSGAAAGRRGGSLWNLLLAAGVLAVVASLLLRTDDEPAPARFTDLAPAAPVRLEIAALGVDAPVVPIQVSADAVLDPPRDAHDVGWWDGSAQPGGGQGQTVITGHTVHTGGGALDRLPEITRGARVDVVTSSGRMRYRVVRVAVLDREQVARDALTLFGQDRGAGRLVLVSCTDWNGSSYDHNVVVLAAPLGQPAGGAEVSAAGPG